MSKLTLDLNALQVQSFVTDEAGFARLGTVHGRQEQTGAATPTACPSAALPCPSAGERAGCNSGTETTCTGTLQCRQAETSLCTARGGPGQDDAETTLCTRAGGHCPHDGNTADTIGTGNTPGCSKVIWLCEGNA